MPRYSEETKQKAREMVASGLTRKEVARRIGASNVMVGRWVNAELDNKAKESSRAWRNENPEKQREFTSKWLSENREHVLARTKEYREQNKEKILQYQIKYRRENRDVLVARCTEYRNANREYMRKLWSDYAKNNPDKNAAKGARYRAMKAQVPQPHSIIEKMMIDNYYEDAKRLTEETGIQHHVDHIWPISKGGPHLPWNLRVIPGNENLAKSNWIGDDWHNQ
jgi:5-methylcytosine-specific restriction endonuclease McrA